MNETAFDQAVAGRKAVVLFHARWCPFCRSFKPVFDKVAGGGGAFEPVEAILDDEENPLWTKFAIDVVPTVIFFEDGKPTRRLDGRPGVGLREEDLRRALEG